jgi:hypothetical protein
MATNKPTLDRQSKGIEIDKNLRIISDLAQGRKFQMWRYYVSHRTLLIRSPNVEDTKENIDIVISGVSYISARTSYEVFSFELGTESDRDLMVTRLGRAQTKQELVFCLVGEGWRDHIIASGVYPSVNSASFLETPDLPLFEIHTPE